MRSSDEMDGHGAKHCDMVGKQSVASEGEICGCPGGQLTAMPDALHSPRGAGTEVSEGDEK